MKESNKWQKKVMLPYSSQPFTYDYSKENKKKRRKENPSMVLTSWWTRNKILLHYTSEEVKKKRIFNSNKCTLKIFHGVSFLFCGDSSFFFSLPLHFSPSLFLSFCRSATTPMQFPFDTTKYATLNDVSSQIPNGLKVHCWEHFSIKANHLCEQISTNSETFEMRKKKAEY